MGTSRLFRIFVFFGLSLLLTAPSGALGQPLPSDPRIISGQLDNGAKWLFLKHGHPPGKLALMMHVRTGSLNETDDQRGLAHFVEHMVFNGTDNFPPGALLPYFESIGMKFGADLNATTSFERTGYSLFLPSVEPAQVDKALTVLSDYAYRATLTEKEIDEERGVILEEARAKKSAGQRVRDKMLPQLFAGSRFAARMPIGDEHIVATAPPSELLNYYRTWYRPEHITLLIVGDTDVAPIVPMMGQWFGRYVPEKPPRKRLGAEFKTYAEPRAIVVSDPELTSCTVQMSAVLERRPRAVTVEQYRLELLETIGSRIMARRWEEQIKRGTAAYQSAEASVDNFFNETLTVSATAVGEASDWAKMLSGLIVEVRRGCQFGFSERELDLVARELISRAEQEVRTEPTQDARSVVQRLFQAVNDLAPILSAQQRLDLLNQLLPSISPSQVAQIFKERFERTDYAYLVMSPERPEFVVPSLADVSATATQAWGITIEPPAGEQTMAQLMETPPAPGRIVESGMDSDLGVTSVWLENGIRLHHRFMDTKKDQVLVSITLAGGGIEETAENLGVSFAAALAISEPATSRLTSSQIRDLKVGRNVKVGGGPMEDDAFVLRIAGSPKDLEFGFQLVHTVMLDGRIEEPVFRNWKATTRRRLERNQTDVSARASDALGDLLSGGDPRRRSIQPDELDRLAPAQAQAWFSRLCREAPIEVSIVGDIAWEQVKPMVETYLGSLPVRPRSAEHLDSLRHLSRTTGPLERQVDVPTVTPAAVAYAGFVGCEGRQIDDRRALQLAEYVLTMRLNKRIREELGLVYSISASSQSGWIYRDYGVFRAGSKCKPENADRVVSEIHAIFEAFAASGPTDDELATSKKQILNKLDLSMREPQYWSGLLENLDLRGRSLEEARTHRSQYTALTANMVQAVFRKYYTPERRFSLHAIPVNPGDAASP